MAAMTFSHNGSEGYPTQQRESHWQPALRPDAHEDILTVAPGFSSEPSIIVQESVHDQITTARSVDPEVSETNTSGHELPSDDDDERLDPAWGIKRTDSAFILDGVHRSSSFPKFVSENMASTVSAPSANEDREEAAVKEGEGQSEEPSESFTKNFVHPADPAPALSSTIHQPEDPSEGMPMEHEGQAPVFGKIEEQESGALMGRFEEGLPLIDSEHQPTEIHEPINEDMIRSSTFDIAAGEDEASFFSQLKFDAQGQDVPPTFDRKSTSDVLDGLEMSQSPVLDSPSAFRSETKLDVFAQEPSADDLFSIPQSTEQTKPEEIDTDTKWAAVLDDDEFLIDDADDLLPDSDEELSSDFLASLKDSSGAPEPEPILQDQSRDTGSRGPILSQAPSNPYTPHQPSTSDLTQMSPKAYGNIGLNRPGLAPIGSFQNQLQRPSVTSRAESFADQAKGGYKSPYDLPVDLSKPKKRPQTQRVISQPQKGVPLPPPRTSSMHSEKQLQPPFTPAAQGLDTAAGSSVGSSQIGTRAVSSSAASSARPAASSSSSFFEELPATSRARPASGMGRYTPSQNSAQLPPQLAPQSPPRQSKMSALPQPPPTIVQDPIAQFQLQPPERLDPYANVPLQAPSIPAAAPTSRYSPAPPGLTGNVRPTPSPRYSPAPPPQAPAGPGRYASQPIVPQVTPQSSNATNRYVSQPVSTPPATLPFQPRTSSPLAYQRPPAVTQTSGIMAPPSLPKMGSADLGTLSPPRPATVQRPSAPPNPLTFSPPPASNQSQSDFLPPKRSQTQSPSRQMGPRPTASVVAESVLNRPASAYGHVSPVKAAASLNYTIPAPVQPNLRPRTIAQDLDLIRPTDDTQFDPLERWKGAPIFRFGFGGSEITSFPKHTPRYSSGLTRPQLKTSAGEVAIRKATEVMPLPEQIANFPGPLRGKSKKKDVLNWLTSSITRLEAGPPSFLGLPQILPDPRKRHEEKVILWKIVKVLVDHDGAMDINAQALKSVNAILAPEIYAIDESTASQYPPGTAPNGIYQPAGTTARSDSTDPLAVEALRKHLMKGKREDAVWHAVDNRLWSHALLIASTLDRSIWKQVVQEFVRQEVKTIGNNAESLAAMYEILGGNLEESVDQLVPPSARAGLQMVSKVDPAGPTKNALDGLDRWKETLTLILNNRSPDDRRALITLAKLLGDYGRTEAAHICYIFARNPAFPSLFGGIDDQQACVTLLGADARIGDVHLDEDAVLLTEIYEFATSTLGSASTAMPLPYLSSYKLQRARQLADHGMKAEAQAYCEAIAAGVGTKTKVSPYFHPVLLAELDDLSNRLKQVPIASSSWITKPSIEKVSGSIFSKFTNFVAGEDSDAASQGSGKDANTDVGPFANVSGSPTLSRSGSQTDLYSGFPTMTPAVSSTTIGSRYAPNGLASTRSSSELVRGRPSIDSQRSPPVTSYGHESRNSLYAPITQQNQSPARGTGAYQPIGTSPGQTFGTSPSLSNYQATPPQTSYVSNSVQHSQVNSISENQPDAYMPNPPLGEQTAYMPTQSQELQQPAFGGISQSQEESHFESFQPEQQPAYGYDATQSYGYEPPADTGYVPYVPEPDSDEDSGTKKKPKKKSFIDDDNDDYSQVTRPSQQTRSAAPSNDDAVARRKAADEAADAAFRAAAAEDERRAKEAAASKRQSSSWFGGWLGGKKPDPNSLDSKPASGSGGSEPKVHKANLGESKMKLYYDEKLKKWVNPDDPDSAKPKAGPAPPPRMGGLSAPPMSSAMGPPPARSGLSPVPSMDASRSGTPASAAGDGIASTNIGAGPADISLPPSKTGTPSPAPPIGAARPPMKTGASDIDDLLGPPSAGSRKPGAKGAKKKAGRYVDVMAK